jgi:hypothetical protein
VSYALVEKDPGDCEASNRKLMNCRQWSQLSASCVSNRNDHVFRKNGKRRPKEDMMGNMVTFTCRKCGHEQNILWGAGLFSYNDEEFADDIKDPEMSREIRLILQQDGAVVESIMESGYYCPLCYIWHDFLYFSIVTEHLVHTPIYQCEKCHNTLQLVPFENYADYPWKCQKCSSCNDVITSVSRWF